MASPENSKAAFWNMQSTSLSKANSNHDNWQANRQKSPEEQFCLQISPEGWLAGFGHLVVMTVLLAVRIAPIKFEHKFASQRFFFVLHGISMLALTCLRQEFRPRIVKRNLYAALRARTIFFFYQKNPKKSVHQQVIVNLQVSLYIYHYIVTYMYQLQRV